MGVNFWKLGNRSICSLSDHSLDPVELLIAPESNLVSFLRVGRVKILAAFLSSWCWIHKTMTTQAPFRKCQTGAKLGPNGEYLAVIGSPGSMPQKIKINRREGGEREREKRGGSVCSPAPLLLSHSHQKSAIRLALSPLTYLLSKYGRSLVAEFEGKKAKVWRPSHPRVHHDTIQSMMKK